MGSGWVSAEESTPRGEPIQKVRLELLCEMCELEANCSVPCGLWNECFDRGGVINLPKAQSLFRIGL